MFSGPWEKVISAVGKRAEGGKKTISGGWKNHAFGQDHAGGQKKNLRYDGGQKKHGGRKNEEPKIRNAERPLPTTVSMMTVSVHPSAPSEERRG